MKKVFPLDLVFLNVVLNFSVDIKRIPKVEVVEIVLSLIKEEVFKGISLV